MFRDQDEQRLIAKLRKIKALFARPGLRSRFAAANGQRHGTATTGGPDIAGVLRREAAAAGR